MEESKYFGAMKASTNSPGAGDPITDEEDSSAACSPSIVRRTACIRTKVAHNKSDEEVTEELPAKALPHIFTSDKSYSYDERVSLYCDQIIGKFSVNSLNPVSNRMLT